MSAFSPPAMGGGDNMMLAGWSISSRSGCASVSENAVGSIPGHPGVCHSRVTEYRRMPARRRPARAIALAIAAENRRRLVAIGINCTLAASLVALLAMVVS